MAVLLANRANANAENRDLQTPLHLAAERGHKDVVELLLTNKADANLKNNNGQTPLAVTIQRQQKIQKGDWPPTDGDMNADLRRYRETIDLLRARSEA